MSFSDFFDTLGDLDWMAILLGTVAIYVFGAIWYGPLFGKRWAAEHGVSAMEPGKMPEPKVMAWGLVQAFVLNIGIAYFISAIHVVTLTEPTIETLFVTALMLGVLVIGAVLASSVIYLKKSWSGWAIDTAYYVLGIAIAAYVQDLVA